MSIRRPNRLPGYDYSRPGYYFVTVCTNNHVQLFGMVKNNKMVQSEAGAMVDAVLRSAPQHYPGVDIDEYIVMPNHVHAIIQLTKCVGAAPRGRPINNGQAQGPDNGQAQGHDNGQAQGHDNGQAQGPVPTYWLSVSDVMRRFKTLTTKKYIDGVNNYNWSSFNKRLWQRSYYDHIIRNKQSLRHIRQYIKNNPQTWESDPENQNSPAEKYPCLNLRLLL